jgi:hypothetical protein
VSGCAPLSGGGAFGHGANTYWHARIVKTGDGRRETGDGRRETGDGRRETGDGTAVSFRAKRRKARGCARSWADERSQPSR